MTKFRRKFRKIRRNINKDVAEAGLLILYLGVLHKFDIGVASIVSGTLLFIGGIAKHVIPILINIKMHKE